MNVVLRPEAVDDLHATFSHYAEIDAALAGDFADAFDLLLERLQLVPRSGRPVEGVDEVRRARLRRFPYGVFYRLAGDDLAALRTIFEGDLRVVVPEQ